MKKLLVTILGLSLVTYGTAIGSSACQEGARHGFKAGIIPSQCSSKQGDMSLVKMAGNYVFSSQKFKKTLLGTACTAGAGVAAIYLGYKYFNRRRPPQNLLLDFDENSPNLVSPSKQLVDSERDVSEECKICFEAYSSTVIAKKLIACGHSLCTKCLGQCKKRECPFCRAVIKDNLKSNLEE